MAVEVATNGQDFTKSGRTYAYVALPTVRSVTPKNGPPRGHTEVLVEGTGFLRSSHLTCKFGAATSTAAAWFNDSFVVCLSPPLNADDAAHAKATSIDNGGLLPGVVSVKVEVSNHGAGPGANFSLDGPDFAYAPAPVLEEAHPPAGPASGNFSVVVRVGPLGLDDTDDLRCRFGHRIVKATRLDGGSVRCIAPAAAPGLVDLDFTRNDQDYTGFGLPFRYYEDPAAREASPVSGPGDGAGTLVTVRGRGFQNTSLLSCRFGYAVVPGVWVDGTSVRCRAPPLTAAAPGLGFEWSSLSEQHRRHPDPNSGSTRLFPGSQSYPHYKQRLVTLELSNNGQDFTDSGLSWLYQAPATVEAVAPKAGGSRGLDAAENRPALFVKGTNLVNASSLRCLVGDRVLEATYISPILAACFPPPREELPDLAPLRVEVAVNGVDYTADRVHQQVAAPCPVRLPERVRKSGSRRTARPRRRRGRSAVEAAADRGTVEAAADRGTVEAAADRPSTTDRLRTRSRGAAAAATLRPRRGLGGGVVRTNSLPASRARRRAGTAPAATGRWAARRRAAATP